MKALTDFEPSSDVSTVLVYVDITFSLLASLACVETTIVLILALRRHSRKLYHLELQTWTIRVMMVGPVYSILMWVSLWLPRLDYFIALPVGFYEAYAIYSFMAMLIIFAGGEEKLVVALGSVPGRPTCFFYHVFPCCGTPTVYSSWLLASPLASFSSSRKLYRFLKICVAQFMVVKPCVIISMAVLLLTESVVANEMRVLSIMSLIVAVEALTQIHMVVLPRIRAVGGEKIFLLLQLMVTVIIVQEVVVSGLLLNSGAPFATVEFSTRLIFILTILEFTVFCTIFYRLLPPERFARVPDPSLPYGIRVPFSGGLAESETPTPARMSVCEFARHVFNPMTMFTIGAGSKLCGSCCADVADSRELWAESTNGAGDRDGRREGRLKNDESDEKTPLCDAADHND